MHRVNDLDLFAAWPQGWNALRSAWLVIVGCVLAMPAGVRADDTSPSAQQQVFAAERAFARSMANRDREAFARHVADEAVFFGAAEPLRGKAQVVQGWSKFFDGDTAPFSWEPDQVEVLPSGQLALSTGLVRDPQGKVVARFNSIWRLEAPGDWRVVFDKGSPPGPNDPK